MRSLRICLVMFGAPFDTVKARLQGRIKLFGQISNTFYLLIDEMPTIQISDGKVQLMDLKMRIPDKKSIHPSWMSSTIRLFKYILIQAKMCYALFKISNDIDIVIFSTGIPFVLPLILQARIMRKKAVVMAGGTAYRSFIADNPRRYIYSGIIWMLETICYLLSTNIAAETESAVHFLGLSRFMDKVSIFCALIYIDTDIFRINHDLRERRNTIGYTGSLTARKGVMNFVEATKLILKRHNNIEFLIGGGGPLFDRIRDNIESCGLQHKVKLVGWVSDDKIPDYLNKLRLLVLPSCSEGLPGIILEAMACGTPVLATPVGGIPDVIKDRETGFIMEDNSPECIAENVERVLNYPDLDKIVEKARKLIEEEYSYEAAVKRYIKILERVYIYNDA